MDLVRLACVKRAASVHPEPGSNSPTKLCPIRSRTEVLVRTRAIVRRAQHVVPKKRAGKGSRVRCVLAVWPIVLTPSPKRVDRDDRPVSVFGATRDGDTEIDWADTSSLESEFSSARTGILSSLLFSRSHRLGTHRELEFYLRCGVGALLFRMLTASVERLVKL